MTYKSAAALEMAVKAAAAASSLDTSRAISSFYFHRLLCRIFAGGNDSFVLSVSSDSTQFNSLPSLEFELLISMENEFRTHAPPWIQR